MARDTKNGLRVRRNEAKPNWVRVEYLKEYSGKKASDMVQKRGVASTVPTFLSEGELTRRLREARLLALYGSDRIYVRQSGLLLA